VTAAHSINAGLQRDRSKRVPHADTKEGFMHWHFPKRAAIAACAVALLGTAGATFAQARIDYPARPVRVICTFTPGSLTDVTARILAGKLTETTGQQFVVDNRAGAGGTIGTIMAAEASPDGYTLLAHSSGYAIAPALYPKLKVNMLRDFQALSIMILQPHALTIGNNLGPKNIKDFFDHVAKKQEKFVWGSAGVGSSTHLVGEKFFLEAKFKHTHVPYKGTPEALLDAMTGRVEVFFAPIANSAPFHREGKAIMLAVTSKKRSPLTPNVPTLDETVLPGFEYDVWTILAAPSKTPKPVLARLTAEIQKIYRMPDVLKTIETMGGVPGAQDPAQAQAFAAKEIEALGRVARAANVPTF
jgi:tripartite-type tricarboxylate transporter receptor subunit TctC